MLRELNDILSVIKIYHLITVKHRNAHKVAGKLYDKLSELFDKYQEIYLGYESDPRAVNIGSGYEVKKLSDKEFVEFLKDLSEKLDDLVDHRDRRALLLVLDEINVEVRHSLAFL